MQILEPHVKCNILRDKFEHQTPPTLAENEINYNSLMDARDEFDL